VDDVALADAARVARWDVAKIAEIRDAFPLHWGRLLLKRELRLAHFRKHGSVPDGVTPGWPLRRNVSQIGPKLPRKHDALARRPRKLVKWLSACLGTGEAPQRMDSNGMRVMEKITQNYLLRPEIWR
jgi:hypothetical protein